MSRFQSKGKMIYRTDINKTIDSVVRLLYYNSLILILFLFIFSIRVQGQDIDTLSVKANSYFITKDTSIYFTKDTFLLIPPKLKYKTKVDKNIKTEMFYDSLYSKANNSWITSELHGFVFRKPKQKEEIGLKTLNNSQDPFEKHEGKVIGDIFISNLNFIHSFQQKDSLENNILNKSIANSHITTYKKIIEKNLTFDSHDVVNSFILAENERLLRQLSSLEDARITIVERNTTNDTVDIIVTTVDVFPLGLTGGFASFNDFNLGIYNTNFLGTGVEWSNQFIYKTKYDPDWGYEGKFKYNNFFGSFINAEIFYKNIDPREELRGKVSRDLTTPTINTGGAIDLGIRSYTATVGPIDTLISSTYQDYWIGQKLLTKNVTNKNILLKGRYYVENYRDRPYVDVDSNYTYHKKEQYFGSLMYYNVQYMKSKYILGFGITEDVPYGLILQATGGYEKTEFFEYPYMRFDIGYGKYFPELGYFQLYSSYGGYIDNSHVINEVFTTNIKAFSNLIDIGNYKVREFLRINYIQGDHLFDNRNLKMHKIVQGLRHESIKGNNRISLGLETIIFSPWYYYGFRFAPFILLEGAFINENLDLFDKTNFYSGISTGINIRNESLVFSTFSFRVSYYPSNHHYNGFWGFNFSLSDPKFFKDLSIGKPNTVKYE